MPILLTATILLGTAAGLAILRVARSRFRFSWLVAVAATAVAWLSALLWIPQIPVSIEFPWWRSVASSNAFLSLTLTGISWPYALGLLSLALGVLLTAPARSDSPHPTNWALSLAAAALGLLAVSSGNPLTLVLLWAALDLAEAGVILARSQGVSSSAQLQFAFAARLGSMALALLALVLGERDQVAGGFGQMQGPWALLLPAAALVRLAAFATPWPRIAPSSVLDEVGITLQLAAGASAVAFLSQVSLDAQNDNWLMLAICGAFALYAGWMWLRAPDLQSARPMWVLGMGCLAVAADLRGNPGGATGWGTAMLLAGSALFLKAFTRRWTTRALLLGVWISSSLPFTVTATAWIGGRGSDWMVPIFLVAQAMLLAGFVHHATKPEMGLQTSTGVGTLHGSYNAGVGLPLLVGIVLGFWGWSGAFQLGATIAAAVMIPLVAAFILAKRRLSQLSPAPTQWYPQAWQGASSWIQREAFRLHEWSQNTAESITRTVEGETGIMLSLLLLVLLVSLITGRGR